MSLGLSILEIGFGKGGDLNKWQIAKAGHLKKLISFFSFLLIIFQIFYIKHYFYERSI